MSKKEIVISGISGRWPQSDNLDQLWDNLKKAVPLYQKDTNPYTKLFPSVTKSRGGLKNPKLFDAEFFGFSEKDATDLDAQFRILHETVYESLWDAGIIPDEWSSTRTGFFIGSFFDDTDSVVNVDRRADFLQLSASRIPFFFNFKGPTVRYDTACASSLTALHEAIISLKSGQCDQAIVAGLSVHQRLGIIVEGSELDIFSKSGYSRGLDEDADGYVRCEAVVSIVLQWSTQAKRMYSTILGSSTNADGYTVTGITSPRSEAQAIVIKNALSSASVDPLDVDYIEGHITSTQAGDIAECASILSAYRDKSKKPITLGCMKSNLGHTEAASGLTAIAKVIKIFQTNMIPPNIGYTKPNPKIEGLADGRLVPVTQTTIFKGKYIGVNSFGFGGANAHAVLTCKAGDYQPSNPRISSNNYRLVCFCNRTIQGINSTIKWLQCEPKVVRDDCLSLLDDISLTQVPSGMFARGYVILDDRRMVILDDKMVTKQFKSTLAISLDPSLTNYIKTLSTFKPFKESIDSSINSCYQDNEQITSDVPLIVIYIGIIDLFTTLGLQFDMSFDSPVYKSNVNKYKSGKLSRREVIKTLCKESQLNGKLKGNGLAKCPSSVKGSSQLTLHLGSKIILSENGIEMLQSSEMSRSWLETFLCVLGTFYLHGFPVKLSSLYSTYHYPVSRDCPSLAGLISWSHEAEYPVIERYQHYFELPKRTIHRIDLLDPEFFSVADHVIDDRVIFPATGYIYLIRKHLALIYYGPGVDIFTFSFKVWKVHILRASFVSDPIELTVTYETDSQAFEISSSGTIYARGFASIVPSSTSAIESASNGIEEAKSQFNYDYFKTIESEEMDLNREEFYQELAISGYRYRSAYQNIVSAKIVRSSAVVSYTKDWMALADSFLQLEAFWSGERKLLVPTVIGEMRFDANLFKSMVDSNRELIKVYSMKSGLVGTSGLVFEDVEVKQFPVKGQKDRLRIGQQVFTPLVNTCVDLDEALAKCRVKYLDLCLKTLACDEKIGESEIESLFSESIFAKNYNLNVLSLLNNSLESHDRVGYITGQLKGYFNGKLFDNLVSLIPIECVHPLIDLVAENNRKEAKIAIQNYDFTMNMLKTLIQSQFGAVCKDCLFIDEKIGSVKRSTDSKSGIVLTVYKHRSLDLFGGYSDDYDESSIVSTFRGNFCLIMSRERMSSLEEKLAQFCRLSVDHNFSPIARLYKLMEESNYIEIGSTYNHEIGLKCLLFRIRSVDEPEKVNRMIKVNGDSDCLWFDELKQSLETINNINRIWLVADNSYQNGLLGLTNCLALEPAFTNKIRCIFITDRPFNESTDLSVDLKGRDLLINVCINGIWGYYRTVNVSLDSHQLKVSTSPYVLLETSSKSDGRVQWAQNDILISNLSTGLSTSNDLITVCYSALNFRDVMIANGMMPTNAYSDKCFYRLGTEFSGYTSTGQRIMGLVGGGALASHISTSDRCLIKIAIPDGWSMAEAATVPVCYMTVVYALIIRGNLQPGESVLIHAGSGGIGLAAISLCLSLGCKIYTTVSTGNKRVAVQRLFPQLTDEAFADSRSTSFEEKILKATDGRGVDVVLNSLIHDKFDAGLRVLAENGRFLDISKVDILEDKIIDQMDLKPNITFHAVCLATLSASQRVGEMNRIVRIIEDGIVDGMVKPLPFTIYHHSQVSNAFADMLAAKHIGKILVQLRDQSDCPITKPSENNNGRVNSFTDNLLTHPGDYLVSCVKQISFDPTKCYLVIGGLGGMGLELVHWMTERKVRKIVITSRSGIKTNYQRYAIKRIRSVEGTKVEISRLDAAHGKSALRLIREASRLGPIGGVFNLAVVLRDGLFPNQTLDAFRAVCRPKMEATKNLDILTRQHCPCLDYFVTFSSVASQGNLGQANYGYANSFMERICEARRKDGLPGLAIQWGPVGDVGIAVRTLGDKSSIAGYEPQRIRSCLEVLDYFLQSSISIGFSAIPFLDNDDQDPQDALVRVSRIIGVKDIRVINLKLRLRDLGMDSVQAVEVQEYLEQNFNFSLGAVSIYDLTLENLVKIASVQAKSVEMDSDNMDKIFRPLKTTGSRPVFFFPPAIFDFIAMLPLARGLDRQVYGIDITDDPDITKSWETLTDYYCAKLLDQWPNEPSYDFVSYSLGAAFAFEVARKIQSLRGENSVRRIVFIDSTPFGIYQALSWSVKISSTVGQVSIDKDALFAFLKRMDRKQKQQSWRTRVTKSISEVSNFDLTQDIIFTKYQYIAEMKVEPKLKADALFFKCKYTVSSFEGSIAVSLDKSIDGHIETIMVDSNHAEIVTQCKDLLISECNKFLAIDQQSQQ